MQTVTDEYITAMRSGSRTDRVTGTIALTDGTVIDVTDEILVNGNLSIDERCMNSFDIGTFYTNQMKLAIYDKDALSHEFANARVELCYGLLVGDDYEDIFLGKYTVDGTNCKRVRDRVYLTAYDRSAKFDRTKSEQVAATAMPPYNALQLICSECSVVLATTQAEIEAMSNGTLSIKCDSSRIETMRDCVMWIAGLLGGYARINREGKLEIRKAKYSVSADDQSQIIIDRTLNGKERISTSFSDTRIYPKYMEAYCAGKAKVYTSSYVSTDVQARAGSFSLPENPLISSLSEEKQNAANKAVLAYLDSFKQRTIKTTIYGDPALECGDTIKLTGGSIDVGRNIVGVVTRYTWKFRQQCTVQCAAPDAGEIKTETDVSMLDAETVTDEETGVFVKPKAQSSKKSDGQNTSNAITKLEYEISKDGSNTVLDAILINGVKHYIYCNPIEGVDTRPIYYVEDENGGALSADIFINGSYVGVGVSQYSMINSLMYGAITNGLPKRERLVLFDNSGNNIGDEVTGGWTMRERITDAGVKAIQPYIYPNTLAMVQNESPSYCVLETINKLDLSEYSKVVIKCNVMLYEYGGGRQQTALFSDTSGLVSNCADVLGFDHETSYGVSVGRTDDSSRLFILDISSATKKEGYLGFLSYVSIAGSDFTSQITMKKIWVEK